MEVYKPKQSYACYYILGVLLIGNLTAAIIAPFTNSYIIVNLLRVFMLCYTIYCVYYLVLALTTKYYITEEQIKIKCALKLRNIIINFKDIKAYSVKQGIIKGVKLSGIGNNKFAFGKTIVDKIGLTSMFVTNSSRTLYIKTEEISYGLSPEDFDAVENLLKQKNISLGDFDFKINKDIELHKDKRFFIPFIIVTLIIIFITINPFVLYLTQKLPSKMPLSFNQQFYPVEYGTGRQFAFRQMVYGVLNMMILFCMYYTSYFHAKYDKRSAYKYIYISLLISFVFLLIQFNILIQFA